ncbi:hypothetical protein OH76DRAFT_362267 [Lentinus brumalis]|uniref:Uncharacterized protein n=1 Tax=Lentinus brumalis TaxID=2498619 RepID=A0A371DE06_9APHY|nr:hypothetical protein OH76DRAFT_362267 [Polyporus brumalis]
MQRVTRALGSDDPDAEGKLPSPFDCLVTTYPVLTRWRRTQTAIAIHCYEPRRKPVLHCPRYPAGDCSTAQVQVFARVSRRSPHDRMTSALGSSISPRFTSFPGTH